MAYPYSAHQVIDCQVLLYAAVLDAYLECWGNLSYHVHLEDFGLFLHLSFQVKEEDIINWAGPNINVQNYVIPDSGRYYLRVTHQSNQEGGDEFFYNLSVNYNTPVAPTSAYISGHVYLEDEATPYSGGGYYIEVYEKDGNYYNSYYFADSVYVISEIPAGIYYLSIYSPEQNYLTEWYDDAATMLEATEITIADQDSITDIDFVLDPGSGISGRIFLENYLSDYTQGGSIFLHNMDSPFLNRGYGISPDPEGLFLVTGIRPGDYKLRFDPMSYEESYPSVWYGDVGTQGQAVPITVTAGDTTGNITMIVKSGGLIQGFITMAGEAMTPVSSDSLLVFINPYDEAGFPVSTNGPLINNINKSNINTGIIIDLNRTAENTFSGGYRTSLLYPGFYKLHVLPQSSTLSSWYYSNGAHFDDPGSQMVEVKSDSLHEVPVALNTANGGISGIVNRADGSTPTSKPGIVYAYDATGHMVQSVPIGFDPLSGQLLDEGQYLISGLIDGTYYLMLSFDSGLNDVRARRDAQVEKVTAEIRFRGNSQNWYPDIIVENPFMDQLFFLPIPAAAEAVNVSGSSITDGVNFTDIVSSVSIGEKTIIADDFEISEVYPNPFNPVTTITYNVPSRERVRIDIFNILGQKVATLLDEIKSPGKYNIKWNGKNNFEQTVSTGIYIARMQAAAIQSSKKMIYIR